MSGEISGGVVYNSSWYEANGLEAPDVVNYEVLAEAVPVAPQSEWTTSGGHNTEPYVFDYDSGVVRFGENPYDFDR